MLAYAHVLMESIMPKISLVPRPPPISACNIEVGWRLEDEAIAQNYASIIRQCLMVTKSNS